MSELQFLDRREGKIAFDDSGGTGPLAVCAPGMGEPRTIYRFVTPILVQAGYRVVTVDLRGMGDSSVAWSDYSESSIGSDLLALIRHLNAGAAILVGNSISAGAAVWAAAESAESIAALVLIGPFVRQVHIPRWKVGLFRLALARPWGARAWTNYQRTKLYPLAKPSDLGPFSRAIQAKLRERGRMRAFQKMARTGHQEAEARLDRVRAPALVVMGTADPDFPDPSAEAYGVAARLHGRVALMPGAGHFPQAEVPDAFGGEVLRFLKEAAHAA